MSTVMNLLYVGATLLFVAMVYVQTLNEPPADAVRENWPMRRFWVGERMRRVTLAAAALSAAGAVFVVVVGATDADIAIFVPALMLGGMVLLAFAVAGLVYSILLYRVARADREGF